MELFLQAEEGNKTNSLCLSLFANYIRAVDRKVIAVSHLTATAQEALKITQMPCLIKKGQSTCNPLSIMTAISSACYIEDVMIGAPDSTTRDEVSQLVEMAARLSPAELSDYLNDHMKSRMFVVGKSITVADITLFSTMIQYWHSLDTESKLAKPNCFRWTS